MKNEKWNHRPEGQGSPTGQGEKGFTIDELQFTNLENEPQTRRARARRGSINRLHR